LEATDSIRFGRRIDQEIFRSIHPSIVFGTATERLDVTQSIDPRLSNPIIDPSICLRNQSETESNRSSAGLRRADALCVMLRFPVDLRLVRAGAKPLLFPSFRWID
jgi:hypothetical protein